MKWIESIYPTILKYLNNVDFEKWDVHIIEEESIE